VAFKRHIVPGLPAKASAAVAPNPKKSTPETLGACVVVLVVLDVVVEVVDVVLDVVVEVVDVVLDVVVEVVDVVVVVVVCGSGEKYDTSTNSTCICSVE